MVLLYCPDKRALNQLAAAISPEYDTMATSDPAECFGALTLAMCWVVALPDGADAHAAAWLRNRPARPLVPLVAAVPEETESARRLAAAAPAAVVWWREMHRELGPAIERAIGSTWLGRVANAIEAAPDVAPVLRAALAAACRAVPPIVSVGALSRHVGKSARWLQDRWRCAVPDRGYHLAGFLRWLVLVRAHLVAADGRSREDVSRAVTRSVVTLDRIAQAHMGTTFHALRSAPARATTEAFRRSALAPIAGGAILRELT